MIIQVPLDKITDNPFQTRSVYTGIEELADSVVKMKAARPDTGGLIQVPPARLVAADGQVIAPDYAWFDTGGLALIRHQYPGATVQLAVGHRRLRAFRFLNQNRQDADYAYFPMEFLKLDDQAMADMAWEENSKRKDLTAIEEAEALERAMFQFHYTQAEIGERWGLSQSAVANKLRLRKLPEDAQQAIREGRITERHGRALLAALGKSAKIYRLAAVNIIPPKPLDDECMARLEGLVTCLDFNKFQSVGREAVACFGCGGEVDIYMPVYLATDRDNGQCNYWLCRSCYRLGHGDVGAPSAAQADEMVEELAKRQRAYYSKSDFPLEAEIDGEGIIKPLCYNCPYLTVEGDRQYCLDKDCYGLKKETWRARREAEVKARFERDYGFTPVIIDTYTGHDLKADTVDAELIKPGGPCDPRQCKRIQLRYLSWEASNFVKPYPDLPYIFNCNNVSSHAAAQRRYMESQSKADGAEKSAAVQKAEQVSEVKAEAKKLLVQAMAAMTAALLADEPAAWKRLAMDLSVGRERETAEEMAALVVEERIFFREQGLLKQSLFWEEGESPMLGLPRFKQQVIEKMSGISWEIPPSPNGQREE